MLNSDLDLFLRKMLIQGRQKAMKVASIVAKAPIAEPTRIRS